LLNTILGSFSSGVVAVPNSYESIATTTVGAGGSATVTFSSIPATYKHLQIRYIARSSVSGTVNASTGIRFNSDTGNNFASHFLSGNGSTIATGAFTSQSFMFGYIMPGNTATSNSFGVGIIDILDYTNTNKNKTIRSLNGHDNNGTGDVRFSSGVWLNTNAVDTILIDNRDGYNFLQYSQFALYGIKGS